jgi:hypothetical protein
MKPYPILITTIVLLLFASRAFGAVYYVDLAGFDSNPGTQDQPWRTIQKAGDAMVAGDTVMVQSGVYPERVKPKTSGQQGAHITFKAQGSVTNWGFDVNRSFVTIDGFNITANTNTANWQGAIEVYRGLSSIHLVNNFIHDFEPINTRIYGIHFNYASNATVATANCVISNNVFKNTSYIMLSLNCSNAIVSNNVFEFANTHDAIHCFGAYITICDNTFTNLSRNPSIPDHTDIIQTFGDEPVDAFEIIFERNLIVNCEAQLCQLEQKGRANIRNWTFRNNVWANVGMAGNCDLENCRWYNNTFYRCTTNTGGPILLNCNPKGCASNAEIFNNIFFECGSNPGSTQMGWYFPENTNFVFSADYNFVSGLNGAGKGANFRELHGINGGNPWFVDAAKFNFRLRPISPLLGKGKLIIGFTNDFVGGLRPVTNWDIGAFQLPSTQRPPPPSNLRTRP